MGFIIYLNTVNKDKTLNDTYIKTLKKDAKGYKSIADTIDSKLATTGNISDRFVSLSRRLKYPTGQAYYDDFKANYFANLKEWKNKESDPFNLLKLDDIENNRDCLYRFLSWNVAGNKSAAELRAMSAKDIMGEITILKKTALEKGISEKSPYLMSVREIGAFFNDELAKEEYDAFVDGAKAMERLVVSDAKTRAILLDKLTNITSSVWIDVRQKLLDAKDAISDKLKSLVTVVTSGLKSSVKAPAKSVETPAKEVNASVKQDIKSSANKDVNAPETVIKSSVEKEAEASGKQELKISTEKILEREF